MKSDSYIYIQSQHDFGLCGFFARALFEKVFTQVHRAFYGDDVLVPFSGAATSRRAVTEP